MLTRKNVAGYVNVDIDVKELKRGKRRRKAKLLADDLTKESIGPTTPKRRWKAQISP